jgi:predicted AAA+ superfamily ATPase
MLIKRKIQDKIEKRLWQGKIIIIYGARQVGKTTLARELLQKYPESSAYYNCEESDVASGLSAGTSTALKQFFGDKKLVVLDEAQKIKDIGTKLKLLVDNYPEMQVIATGSSSFELSNIVNEPLTGRFFSFQLYPFSLRELLATRSDIEIKRLLPSFMRFGLYPSIVDLGEEEAAEQISLISRSYLFKDIFALQELRSPEVLDRLTQMLALQVGREVSLEELSRSLSVSIETVNRYLLLLERAFVIFRLPAFSRNLRTEIKKSRKIYFFDCGLRNAIISNFNSLEKRDDVGALWENFCLVERIKANQADGLSPKRYFWRTYDQKEIDYIEEAGGALSAFEFKWSEGKSAKLPKAWQENYPGASFGVVSPADVDGFILGKS